MVTHRIITITSLILPGFVLSASGQVRSQTMSRVEAHGIAPKSRPCLGVSMNRAPPDTI